MNAIHPLASIVRGRRLLSALAAYPALAAFAAIAALPAGGCTGYASKSLRLRTALAAGDTSAAMAAVEDIDASTSQLLYLYESGMVLHAAGRYRESNEAFAASEDLLADLYTKSVTREVAALAVSDVVREYRGSPFEAAFVSYYQILNYLYLGDLEGAAVECRQAAAMLQLLRDAGESPPGAEAFLQYVTALVFARAGDRDAAAVSYRAAARAFESDDATSLVPPWFYCDAADNARALGEFSLASEYSGGEDCPSPVEKSRTRVNVFVECGYVARFVEQSINLPILEDDDWSGDDEFAARVAHRYPYDAGGARVKYWLRVALPELVAGAFPYTRVRVSAQRAGIRQMKRGPGTTDPSAWAATVVDVDDVATARWDQRRGSVLLRAVGRALIKYAARNKADKKSEALGALVNIFGAATEAADTRSWSTLPGKVMMARLHLPPGRWRLSVDLFDGTRPVRSLIVDEINVRESADKFVSYRVLP